MATIPAGSKTGEGGTIKWDADYEAFTIGSSTLFIDREVNPPVISSYMEEPSPDGIEFIKSFAVRLNDGDLFNLSDITNRDGTIELSFLPSIGLLERTGLTWEGISSVGATYTIYPNESIVRIVADPTIIETIWVAVTNYIVHDIESEQ